VLSVAVIVVYYLVINVLFPPEIKRTGLRPLTGEAAQTGTAEQAGITDAEPPGQAEAGSGTAAGDTVTGIFPLEDGQQPVNGLMIRFIDVETKLLRVRLTSAGGDIDSFELKKHRDGDTFVNMIFRGRDEPHAFALAFGGRDAPPVRAVFNVRRSEGAFGTRIEFYRDFTAGGKPFTLTKTYIFPENEYMFGLDIGIQAADGDVADGGTDGQAAGGKTAAPDIPWTLYFGPQIGPAFDAPLDGRSDYRNYLVYRDGKLKTEKVEPRKDALVAGDVSWICIAGKYFAFIAVPPDDQDDYSYFCTMQEPEEGLPGTARLFIEHKPSVSGGVSGAGGSGADGAAFKFYLGPKTSSVLDIYDNGDNQFRLFNAGLSKAANTSGFWSILNPLESVLKWILHLFYMLIPNYGLAIILVTILVKVVLFPLTKKSSEGTLRMQALAPKIRELQEKYKDNPQKMNTEMGALYKKEGYNPLSGCLPMLIQIPIFFAMYNLFNNHFELRGALFIPGWIPDLSLPESVYHLPFALPFLGWTDIRLLPFIYVGSQLLYGKVTQTPDQTANRQMKMMLYVMPLVFFFVLYNVPAGLLVYWIMSNVLTLFQQLIINKYLAKKKAEQFPGGVKAELPKRITPPKKRRRR